MQVTATLIAAIQHSLAAAPQPLENDLVLGLLSQLRANAMTRYYFPFDQFLSLLTRDQVSEEIRQELPAAFAIRCQSDRKIERECLPRAIAWRN